MSPKLQADFRAAYSLFLIAPWLFPSVTPYIMMHFLPGGEGFWGNTGGKKGDSYPTMALPIDDPSPPQAHSTPAEHLQQQCATVYWSKNHWSEGSFATYLKKYSSTHFLKSPYVLELDFFLPSYRNYRGILQQLNPNYLARTQSNPITKYCS